MAAQKERLRYLEAQLEAMQRQRSGQSSGRTHVSPSFHISAEDLQAWHTQATQGDAFAQRLLGSLYLNGDGVPQDYTKARQWYEKAAAQGFLYAAGRAVPQDDVRAYMWWNLARPRLDYSDGFTEEYLASGRDKVVSRMTPAQIAEAQRLAQQCEAQEFKGC